MVSVQLEVFPSFKLLKGRNWESTGLHISQCVSLKSGEWGEMVRVVTDSLHSLNDMMRKREANGELLWLQVQGTGVAKVMWLDSENEWITVTSAPEWEEAVSEMSKKAPCCCKNKQSAPVLRVQVCVDLLPRCSGTHAKPATSRDPRCKRSQPRCCVGAPKRGPEETKVPCCEEVKEEEATCPLKRERNVRLGEYKYSGDALRAVALPLGPLGGGSIALAGDGGLRQWQIVNAVNHLAHVPDSFFAIKTVTASDGQNACVLMSDACYDQSGFTPAPIVQDHVVPAASIQLLKDLPGMKTLEVTARCPIAEVDYLSSEAGPVSLHLETFNPCIPLDPKDSALPMIVFAFTVQNTGQESVTVSLLGSQQNIVGWDGQKAITEEVKCDGYGGNVNAVVTASGLTSLMMSNSALRTKDEHNGEVALSVVSQEGDVVSSFAQYTQATDLWKQFTSAEMLPGHGTPGSTWNGALETTFKLAPGATRTVTFLLSWHFPNRFVNWSQKGFGIDDPNSSFWLGNQYTNFWATLQDVITYTVANLAMLSASTRLFRDLLFTKCTLPWQLIDSAAGRLSVLSSPTCMWLGDETFYAFEGCSPTAGCCPLNCTHVWNYPMTVAFLFPTLEQSMRVNDLQVQIAPNSIIPSRTTVPTDLKRIWASWPDYTQVDPASTAICVDGEIGTVLKTLREVHQGAGMDWLKAQFPHCKAILERWLAVIDSKGDGVIFGYPQPNTYDCSIYSANTFIGTLYIAGLRAGSVMATLVGDQAFATTLTTRAGLAEKNYDAKCWSSELGWYIAVEDPAHPVEDLSYSSFVDCFLGLWWSHLLGLGAIFPADRVRSTLTAIFTNNHRTSFDSTQKQAPRVFYDERDAGMFVARWPSSHPMPKDAMLYTSEATWSGLVYPFAALCFQYGLHNIGMQVLTDLRACQDGTRRSPWNEIECGDHYSRPMSGWGLINIASGFHFNAITGTHPLSPPCAEGGVGELSFAPILSTASDRFSCFYVTATGWGMYAQTAAEEAKSRADEETKCKEEDVYTPVLNPGDTVTVDCQYGTVTFSKLTLATVAPGATVTLDGVAVSITAVQAAGVLVLTAAKAVEVKAGSCVKVVLDKLGGWVYVR